MENSLPQEQALQPGKRDPLAKEKVDGGLLLPPERKHTLPAGVEVRVVDLGVTLDRHPGDLAGPERGGIGDRERHLWIGLDVLELLREEDARGEVDQLSVVKRDQRMRHRPARRVDDRELAHERRLEQCFDRFRKDPHRPGRYP